MTLVKTELKAKDVMTPDPVCLGPSASIRELASVFEEHGVSGVPVVDQQGTVIGIVTKTDLIRRCSEGIDDMPPAYLFEVLFEQGAEDETSEVVPEPLVCVEDIMTEDPVLVSLETPASEVAKLMSARGIHRVIVADDENYPLGIITSMDLLATYGQ